MKKSIETTINQWKEEAQKCNTPQEYEALLNKTLDEMSFAQLAGWLLVHGNPITQYAVEDCIRFSCEKSKRWATAMRTAISEGRELSLFIENNGIPGKSTRILPYLM